MFAVSLFICLLACHFPKPLLQNRFLGKETLRRNVVRRMFIRKCSWDNHSRRKGSKVEWKTEGGWELSSDDSLNHHLSLLYKKVVQLDVPIGVSQTGLVWLRV